MKNFYAILLLFISFNSYSQLDFEYYTNYGYYINHNDKILLNLDGKKQYYFYIKAELLQNIYDPERPSFAIYKGNGFIIQKELDENIQEKYSIEFIEIIKNEDGVRTFFQIKDSEIFFMITRENENYKVLKCYESNMRMGKETCTKYSMHSTGKFKDSYHETTFPTQNLNSK